MDGLNQEYLTIRTAVIVPGLQALVNGLFYGVATGGVIAVANSLELLTVPAWAVGVTVGSLAGLHSWRGLLNDWRSLLYGIEQESEALTVIEPEPVRVELYSDNGYRGRYANLPASPEQLIELGQGITEGESFSVARWTGYNAPFSRGEFEQLRGELLKLGWLEWRSSKDNARGVQVTRGGAAVFRHFASMSSSHPSIKG